MPDKPKNGKWLLALLAIAVPVLIGTATWSGVYNVAADSPHWQVTGHLIQTVRERSITVRSRDIVVPKDLDKPDRISAGAGLYDEMCVSCHLVPATDDTEMRRGLYPRPPAFPSEGVSDPAKAFWAIKHGVKMTAMPAWGPSHTDDQIWDMVAFLLRLKGMTATDYKTLVASAPPESDEHQHMHGH